MGGVGLIDITVGNARFGASTFHHATLRVAHISTQRASRWGHPGGFRAFSAAQNQRQLSPTCLNPCLVPDERGARYWQQCSTAQAADALC
jgi:hypothetical protein